MKTRHSTGPGQANAGGRHAEHTSGRGVLPVAPCDDVTMTPFTLLPSSSSACVRRGGMVLVLVYSLITQLARIDTQLAKASLWLLFQMGSLPSPFLVLSVTRHA